jgi:hypothetical protein
MGGTPSKYAQYSSLPTSSSEDDYLSDYLGGVKEEVRIAKDSAACVEGTSSLETVQSDDAPQYVLDANDFTHDIAEMTPVRTRANMYRDMEQVEAMDSLSPGLDGHFELVDFGSLSGNRSFIPNLEMDVGHESPGTSRRRQSGGQQ